MSGWTAERFMGGWHVGYYPQHDTDWQLSLCNLTYSSTLLDFGKGETRHDWRLKWDHGWTVTVSGLVKTRRFGRLSLRNHASGRHSVSDGLHGPSGSG